MKKRTVSIVLAGAPALTMCGCSAGDGQVAELEQKIQELEQENANLKAQLESAGIEANPTDENPAPTGVQEDEVQSVSLGEAITIPDLCEFTINYADLKKEVKPPNPESFYTYYDEKDGMTYLDVAVSTKNLRTTARSADEFGSVKAICGSGYEYTGFSIIEENGGGDFTYSNITNVDPLETAVIHYLISIPNELADDSTVSIVLEITMLDQDYTLTVR